MARALGLVVGAVGLTVLVTWPLGRCLTSCLGEPPDTLLSVYFLAWMSHALTTPGVRLLDATFFAPYPGTLALGEYMPAYAPVAVPVVALTGNPVLAHNLLLVASYAFAALGAGMLAARLTASWGAGLVAAVAFAYAPRLLDQAYNVQTLAVFWVPWLLLALERFLDGPTWPRASLAAGLALVLALSSLNVFMYAAVLIPLVFAVAAATPGRRLTRRHAIRLGAAGAVALLLLLVYVAPNRALAREWGLGRPLAEVERHSATPGDLVGVPREPLLHWILNVIPARDDAGLVPGLTATGLALAGIVAAVRGGPAGRALRPYAVLWGTAAVLALGPTLRTPGGGWPLPYRALYFAIPGFDAIRTPGRFLVFVDLGLAVTAAGGVAWWLSRVGASTRRCLPLALAGLVILESVAVPFPGAVPRLDPRSVPAVYRWLGEQDTRVLALAIPMGDWINVAAAAFHLRPVVNGWSSYLPPRYPELVDAMAAFPDERTLALVRDIGTDIVLVDRSWLTPGRVAALDASRAVLAPERAFPTHLVYRVRGGRPGLETLRVSAIPGPGGECVTLENPGPGWVGLYPLHRLDVAESRAGGSARTWLPLDLSPGGRHTSCVRGGPPPAGPVRGVVENGRRRYRFSVIPGEAARGLEPAS